MHPSTGQGASAQALVILKTGSTLPALCARRGDFEDWILAGLAAAGADGLPTRVLDIEHGAPLPACEGIAGLIITGSHAMVTERRPWSERAAAWLPGAVERGIPTLGICYGHQLLAYALGGLVSDNPNGREYGTAAITLDAGAHEDALLGGLSNPFAAQVCHTQTVTRLPACARRLARSDRDANQAFAVGQRAWGVQFHPEFDADVMRAYIQHSRTLLEQEGQDPGRLLETTVDTPAGGSVFERFLSVVRNALAGKR